MSPDSVLVDQRGSVCVVTIDRPEVRHALDSATSDTLASTLQHADDRDDIRCTVITATGSRSFCAGRDLKAIGTDMTGVTALSRYLRRPRRTPTIAAVNGPAVGGGFELVLGCDLVIAADHAWFALPEVAHGLFPAGGGTLLPLRVPVTVAVELMLAGGRLGADRAHQLGLVNQVVPKDRVLSTALGQAEAIAALDQISVEAVMTLIGSASRARDTVLWNEIDDVRERLRNRDQQR